MYCAKCGAQISESDRYCPKCGNENINYSAPKTKNATKILGKKEIKADEKEKQEGAAESSAGSGKSKRTLMIAIAGLIAVAVACAVFIGVSRGNPVVSDNSRISYPAYGLEGYVGTEGSVYFVQGGEVRTFEGKIRRGRSTPDRTKFLVLLENGELNMYGDPESESEAVQISKDVITLSTVTDKGCFYTKKPAENFFYYDFETKETTDVGMAGSSYEYSIDGNTVIGLGKDEDVRIFTIGDTSSRSLFNKETADTVEDVCCIADDGSNMVWATKEGNVFNVYMMKNDVPERIGKIKNAGKYSYIYGQYYNNDQSFLVYSNGSSQMIHYSNGEVKELVVPGVKKAGAFFNANGEFMHSSGDYIEEPYFVTAKTDSSETGALCHMLKDGSFETEVDGISLENNWSYSPDYYISNGVLYYIDQNKDLKQKKLGKDNESTLITTDVKALYIPEAGGYAYIVKSGGLYAVDLADSSFKLHQIWNNISNDDSVYMTEKSDTIYFITQKQEIADSYRLKGTLYQYTFAGEAKMIVKDVMYLDYNGERDPSAEHPVIEIYVSHKDYDYVINVGTIVDGEYRELITNAKD